MGESKHQPIGKPAPAGTQAQQLAADLRQQLDRVDWAQPPVAAEDGRTARRLFSSGFAELDALLPRGGFPAGVLVEWLSEFEGGGAATLALLVASHAAQQGGVIVAIDVTGEFYLPAAEALGLDLERLVVIRGDSDDDLLWALDQSLRCPAVAAVWAPLERLERRLAARHLRRWQLAAERGGGLGLLMRPASVQGRPSWAEARFLVRPLPAEHSTPATWNLQVELTRGRGATGPRQTIIRIAIDEFDAPPWINDR